jgi:hypothetical protein
VSVRLVILKANRGQCLIGSLIEAILREVGKGQSEVSTRIVRVDGRGVAESSLGVTPSPETKVDGANEALEIGPVRFLLLSLLQAVDRVVDPVLSEPQCTQQKVGGAAVFLALDYL